MASGDVQVQSAVHSVDQGNVAFFIKAGMITVLLIGLSMLYIFVHFHGLDNPTAMDQAQIARNLASGKGFTTGYIRPLALGMIQSRSGENTSVDVSQFPDFYQSPLNPWVNSLALRLIKGNWKMGASDPVYLGDKMIVIVSLIFFILSVIAWYFVFIRLFDAKLALFACAAILLTDLLWKFSLSGLPQMLVLFLFSLASLTTLLAMVALQKEQVGVMIAWLIGTGVLLGLMTLAHGLAAWIFLGWLIFAGLYFRPRGLVALAALAAFVLVIAPWMVRNFQVCGNPFGIAVFDAFAGPNPEETYLRKSEFSLSGSGMSFKGKIRNEFINQTEGFFGFIGMNVIALAFFVALLHPFRNQKTFNFRWCIAAMWLCAAVGMTLYPTDGPISANQLHVLFIPLFAGYGMAFLLVMWNRLEINNPLFRIVFISLLLGSCAIPMGLRLLAGDTKPIQWPPYVPPIIGMMGEWFDEDEIICSDMPWAVAWYGQRKSLLLPTSVTEFNRLHDYNQTVQPIRGLYLTPVTGNKRLFADIYKGDYKEWALLITRPPQLKGFPLTAFTPLPIEGECIIYADRDRWNQARNP